MTGDSQTTVPARGAIITKTEKLLTRAREIDPDAWAVPLRVRMETRRNRSYRAAVQEMMDRD